MFFKLILEKQKGRGTERERSIGYLLYVPQMGLDLG